MNQNKTIFIAIAAYNETDVVSTIENCLENAEYPDRLHFGLALHYSDMPRPEVNFKNTKIVYLEYGSLFGVCPARAMTLNLYDNEDYYLQIDGHMKFDVNWDTYLVNTFNEIKKSGVEKPLITSYVPWWSENEDGTINLYNPINTVPNGAMYFEDALGKWLPNQRSRYINWDAHGLEFYEHYGFAAHFAFAEAEFIFEIPPDPQYMFFGEEPTTALRAWTRGYRIFSIKRATAWHKNKGKDVGHLHDKDRHFYNGYDANLIEHHHRKNRLGEYRAQLVLTGLLLGFWGAPDFKSYLEYVDKSGFNFEEFYTRLMEKELNSGLDSIYKLGYNSEREVVSASIDTENAEDDNV